MSITWLHLMRLAEIDAIENAAVLAETLIASGKPEAVAEAIRMLKHATPQDPQALAEARVLAVRGSHDAPGFDACVAAEMQAQPSKADIARFLAVFHALDEFESTARLIRGYGGVHANDDDQAATARVLDWLRGMA